MSDPIPAVELQPFSAVFAGLVASWVQGDAELAWLSPETPPPLTAAKVVGWGHGQRRQFLFRRVGHHTPMGYGELNDMPGRAEQQWIGHFILDPAARGQALGMACVQRLLMAAFEGLGAHQVLLVVVPDNLRAIACYQRAGLIHLGDEWKRDVRTQQPYRLMRMGLDRAQFAALRSVVAPAAAG